MVIEMKKCTKCGIEKERKYFNKRNNTKCGLQSKCKQCEKEYIEKNKENKKLYYFGYYKLNKDRLLKTQKLYLKNNADKRKKYIKNYRTKNKDKILEQGRIYKTKRRTVDDLYKMIDLLRSRLRYFLKSAKPGKTIEHLGCDIDIFKKHLESKFQNGMSFDNYGMWHIDHIVPLSSAKTKEDLLKLYYYKNTQPLWAIDNLKKGSRFDRSNSFRNEPELAELMIKTIEEDVK